jgi:leucyl-tRNA synthetase
MNEYDHKKIETKWQKVWEKKKPNKVKEDSKKKKFYALIEFPYPSGAGLHIGHPRSYVGMDIIARKKRAEGLNVMYPIGWDAFGLPAENYAIKTGINPAIITKKNSDTFKKQIKSLGISFDWSREIDTTDPKYYKWTQWIFLQFLKAGLAYKKKMTINWCPKDLTGLANEEVINGCCERCGTKVEKKEKEQWMLAITKYAERLDKDLDETDFLEKIKIQQRNWIGKSEGAEIDFQIKGNDKKIKVFTTRPDTLFGVTYVVLAPEHEFVGELIAKVSNKADVEKYIKESKTKSEIDRTDAKTEKTGVELKGVKAINPANNEEVPVWLADYVLADYGTGAVMAVPAHDERDWDFAKKYRLEIRDVVMPVRIDYINPHVAGKKVVERKAIQAIIRNPKNGKILCLKWKKQPWTTFVVGGVEEGENVETAARREILEETGIKDLKFIRILGGPVKSEFFAAHKDENRVAYFNVALFELDGDASGTVSKDESEKHEPIWLDLKDIRPDTMRCGELDIWLHRLNNLNNASTEKGLLINSGKFNSKDSESVKQEITEFVGGKWVTKFKLRDWIFSRQRYWGEPIPVVHCEKCGIVPLPDKELPLKLPKVKNYAPTESGESPLASIDKWVNTKCPKCKGKAKRETDTMPNWAGSSWYYLRYMDPKNNKAFADKKKLKYWGQVDWYNGGMEHTTLHLLYSRFWHKFLFDQGLVPTSEPYKKRTSHGMILAEGGEKMSKSRGNVINPDDIVKTVGADTLRIYEMFMGPFDQAIAWDTNNIAGARRFIEKVWKLQEKVVFGNVSASDYGLSTGYATKTDPLSLRGHSDSLNILVHKTIKKVTEDIEDMKFNTAISGMMILVNEIEKGKAVSKEHYEILLRLLSPFAPHFTEEIWANLKNKKSIHTEKWPKYDEKKLVSDTVSIMVQINGKVRGMIEANIEADESFVREEIKKISEINKWLVDKEIKKVIFIKGKLINIVI